MKRFLLLSLIATSCLTLGSCYDPHAQGSRIVREIEANGSGGLNTFTLQGLVAWFGERPKFAAKINAECTPLWPASDANWITTAEGTACRAARIATPPPQMTADQRAW